MVRIAQPPDASTGRRARTRQRRAAVIALGMLGVAAAGCGTRVASSAAPSSPAPASTTTSSQATTTTVDAAAVKAQVTAVWERFFSAQTPLAERRSLLESGAQYDQALAAASKDPRQSQSSARVTDVQLTAPDRAAVIYDVLLNGQPALTGSQGVAILQDGTWKVSGQSFCALVTLAGPVPGCG